MQTVNSQHQHRNHGCSSWQCKFMTSVSMGILWKQRKPSALLCGRKCIYWRGQRSLCSTHAVFVFNPENIWDLHWPSQRNPSIAFPLVPLPLFEPARLPHICIKMKSGGNSVFAIFCWLQKDHFHISWAYFHDLLWYKRCFELIRCPLAMGTRCS